MTPLTLAASSLRSQAMEFAVFGAGPIGLGAAIGFKRSGASHVVVIDIQPARLEKALAVGADAVINSAEEDMAARLGTARTRRARIRQAARRHRRVLGRRGRPGRDRDRARERQAPLATLGIVAVHKKPVEVPFGDLLDAEVNIVFSMGYPDEIFQVTEEIADHWEQFAVIVSDTFPFEEAQDALTVAATPGAADKVVVTLG
jgi:threonine dehydrogenase-like Zn-dependent dehydrogenase